MRWGICFLQGLAKLSLRKMALQRKYSHSFDHLALALWLFQGKLKPTETTEKSPADEKAQDFSRIRCPFCNWRPDTSSRWFCGDCDYPEYFFDGCGMAWNTFSTRGVCPGCGHQWRWTICLRCCRWSLHEQWYENNNPKT